MTKLTLSVDEEIVKEAKRLAEQRGTSVSGMFSQMVRGMAAACGRTPHLGRTARLARGIAHLPSGVSDSDLLTEALMEKYGLSK